MDDLYQYTADAVKANNNDAHAVQTNHEDDALVNAFNNFGFGQRWSSLVDSVKKQSQQVIDFTRSDLQEFAEVLREDTTQTVEKLSKAVAVPVSTARALESPENDVKGKGKAPAVAPQPETSTTAGVWTYLSHIPSHLPSAMHLPGGIDLGKLRDEMDQGTRFAEQYMQKFGTEVMEVLNKTITVLGPQDDETVTTAPDQSQHPPGGPSTVTSNAPAGRIFASRKDQLLAEMRSSPDTFLKDPEDAEALNKFNVDDRTDEIARLLEEHPELRNMMDTLVPLKATYVLFWKRYFYQVTKIDEDDKKRQLITKAAQNDDDFKWDSDDEDNEQRDNANNNAQHEGKSAPANPHPKVEKQDKQIGKDDDADSSDGDWE